MAIRVHFQDQSNHFHTACTFSAIPEDAKLVWIDFENPTKNDQALLTQRFNIARHHIGNLYLQLRDLKLVIIHRKAFIFNIACH